MDTQSPIALNQFVTSHLPDGGGYTWTLASRLGQILQMAQERFGQRDLYYTILGVEFIDGIPQVWYPGSHSGRKDIIIQLSLECLADPMRSCYQLAHESIHLLSPTGGKAATVLEEGLATYFSAYYMREKMAAPDWHSNMKCYAEAQAMTEALLKIDPDAIKKLRVEQPTISAMSADLLLRFYPALGVDLAERLTTRFERYQD
ncbi:MAG: hypothetical protein H0X30_00275 [Anaerolineae bacterium]|nr:hypothetical protein [Anaerolineae bacterium]